MERKGSTKYGMLYVTKVFFSYKKCDLNCDLNSVI